MLISDEVAPVIGETIVEIRVAQEVRYTLNVELERVRINVEGSNAGYEDSEIWDDFR